jgi:hypothetical protein
MDWETPTFEEIRMDAEIGSYQEEPEPLREPVASDDDNE